MKKKPSGKDTHPGCRALAAQVVADVMNQKASLATLLPNALQKTGEKDRSLLQDFCYGTLRHFYSLRQEVERHLAKPLKRKDSDILALLMVGAYQLRHTRIPDYAAINSSVIAATELRKDWAKSLINAVLRQIQRSPATTSAPGENEVRFEHPQWLIDAIGFSWPQHKDDILLANNSKAPMTLRINTHRQDRVAYLQKLQAIGISARPTTLSDAGLQLETAVDVEKLPLFDAGAVSVQDEAAQLTAVLLGVRKNDYVLDACAAPGGKTCHILERTPDAHVIALDVDPDRIRRVEQNLQRLRLSATVITADARHPETWWKQAAQGRLFDRILLDAPCSATGVIRHHPDIKLLRQASDIPVLAKIQLQLLYALWPLLKPQGILLYTTCSILNEENDKVLAAFFAHLPDASIETIDAGWGIPTKYGRQLLPQPGGHDGFYFSRIRKVTAG